MFCGVAGGSGDLIFFAAKVDMWYNKTVSEDFDNYAEQYVSVGS